MKSDLEKDLKRSYWILKKVKNKKYAQELYAALCNMQWQKLEVIPILKEELWHCSWRYSGGLVAELQGYGDYMNWYCSGNEGKVSKRIASDLKQLGWIPVEWDY
jgi:hypothetical protein